MYETVDIGRVIKDLRKSLNLSQQQLAEGICTQAQISKIENSNEIPSSLILYKISRKLGVDMNYFFEIAETPRLDYVRDVYQMIRYYIRERDYQSVYHIVQKEKGNALFQTIEHQQFFTWHEGICQHYLFKDLQSGIDKLKLALSMTYKDGKTLMKEREIEIANSLAIFYKEKGKYEQSLELYTKLLQSMKFLEEIKDETIYLRIYYGIGKAYTDLGDYQKSLVFCQKGIKKALRMETLYLLGELYFQCGSNYYRMGDVDHGSSFIKKSITIFRLQGKEEMIHAAQRIEAGFLEKGAS
ncbi:helix-turn-helix domain-containing protein [Metabacillus sp. YM-086]|uniref:helix-turn-helix domain-containing protein n=1 Tax=Metabacillus sp. YM-086 TaxID=3341729 RepID=UPI003A8416C9